MTWNVQPEPTDETERRALLAALEEALSAMPERETGPGTRWWRSGFDELGGGPAPQQAWSQPRVVEP